MPKAKTTTKKKTPNKPLGDNNKTDYRKLTDYIQSIYDQVNLEPPWALFMTQVKDIRKNYNIDYIEILHILQYMVQIENIDITDRDTLGLVPYFIDKTHKYIEEYKESKKNINNFTFNEEIIKVKPSNYAPRTIKKNESFDD